METNPNARLFADEDDFLDEHADAETAGVVEYGRVYGSSCSS